MFSPIHFSTSRFMTQLTNKTVHSFMRPAFALVSTYWVQDVTAKKTHLHRGWLLVQSTWLKWRFAQLDLIRVVLQFIPRPQVSYQLAVVTVQSFTLLALDTWTYDTTYRQQPSHSYPLHFRSVDGSLPTGHLFSASGVAILTLFRSLEMMRHEFLWMSRPQPRRCKSVAFQHTWSTLHRQRYEIWAPQPRLQFCDVFCP